MSPVDTGDDATRREIRLGVGGLAAGVPLIGGDEREAGDSNDRMGLNDNTAAEPEDVSVGGADPGTRFADQSERDADESTGTTTGTGDTSTTTAAPPDDGETGPASGSGSPRNLEQRVDRLEQKIDQLLSQGSGPSEGGIGDGEGGEIASSSDSPAQGATKTVLKSIVNKETGAGVGALVGAGNPIAIAGGALAGHLAGKAIDRYWDGMAIRTPTTLADGFNSVVNSGVNTVDAKAAQIRDWYDKGHYEIAGKLPGRLGDIGGSNEASNRGTSDNAEHNKHF